MTITLIRYPLGATLPEPWQPDWGLGNSLPPLPSLLQGRVGRAPAGTPIPAGTEPYAHPPIHKAMRATVRADLAALVEAGRRGTQQERWVSHMAQIALDDSETLDRHIAAQLGSAHPYATLAPMSVRTLQHACAQSVRAGEAWTSRQSCGVIRPAMRGYQAWIGVGGMIDPAGTWPDYAAAEAAVIAASAAARAEAMQQARAALPGWPEHTPYYTATLATAATKLPLHIRRGPMMADEAGSSWDIPIVAVWRDGAVIERHDDRVTWGDDDSRQAARQRERAGQAARNADTEAALKLIEAIDWLRPSIRAKRDGLTVGPALLGGRPVRIVGPVRMRDDGHCALVLVRYEKQKQGGIWASADVLQLNPDEAPEAGPAWFSQARQASDVLDPTMEDPLKP